MKTTLHFLIFFSFSLCAKALTNSNPALALSYDSTVQIRTTAHDPADGGAIPSYCNATLLNDRLLVTAAHCLIDAFILKSATINVEVGRYRFVTKPDGQVVRIGYAAYLRTETIGQFYFSTSLTRRILNQGFSTSIGPNEDLAVILLSQPLSLPIGFIFGQTVSQKELLNIQRSPQSYSPHVVTLNPFEEIATTDTKRIAELNVVRWKNFFHSQSRSRVQPGDSGAPLYVNTTSGEKLIGVVKGEGHNLFSSWDAYSPLDSLICDIANQLQIADLRILLCHN